MKRVQNQNENFGKLSEIKFTDFFSKLANVMIDVDISLWLKFNFAKLQAIRNIGPKATITLGL